jgi:hypothetical protein
MLVAEPDKTKQETDDKKQNTNEVANNQNESVEIRRWGLPLRLNNHGKPDRAMGGQELNIVLFMFVTLTSFSDCLFLFVVIRLCFEGVGSKRKRIMSTSGT